MSRATFTENMKTIFDEFEPKIKNPAYYPETPLETLKSRMTAVSYLESDDPDMANLAAEFIKRTSTTKEEDLQRLKKLAATIINWENLEICSVYKNGLGSFVEYKIGLTTTEGKELIHLHALYKEEDGKSCYISQTPPLVRVIGDPILHSPGKLFPATPTAEQMTELNRQIDIATDVLITTCGAGIAANQCRAIESPYQFTIVGIFKDIPAHVEGVTRRYPGASFPPARIMVNPEIIGRSEEMQTFKHACLSVPSPNRCEVQSPMKLKVRYLDPTQGMAQVEVELEGMDAVVLWHELNHIVDGKTYIDTALASLSPSDLTTFERMVEAERLGRDENSIIPNLTVPPFYFTITINDHGKAQLDEMTLTDVLPKFTTETLKGFLKQCNALRENNNKMAEKEAVDAIVEKPSESGVFSNVVHHHIPSTGVSSAPSFWGAPKPLPSISELLPSLPIGSAKALFPYIAKSSEEISFAQGQKLLILEKQDDGRWRCQSGTETGLAPSALLEEMLLPSPASTSSSFNP